MLPTWHPFAGVHGVPCAQPEQTPFASQTPPLHGVPGAAGPLSAQTGAPVLHSMRPARHAAVRGHEAPALHATHVPFASHTLPSPHTVPAAAFVC